MMRSSSPLDPRAMLGAVKARPGGAFARRKVSPTAGLDCPCADASDDVQAGTKERSHGTNKGTTRHEELSMT
jgi:hypothetical protein